MKKIITVLLSLCLMFSSFSFAYAGEKNLTATEKNNAYQTVMELTEMFGLTDKTNEQLLRSALLKIADEDDETFYKVLNAIAQSIDEYSYYYSPSEWEAFSKEMEATIAGIGVTAITDSGYFEVVTVIEGGSAKEAGIKPKDRIIEADGVNLVGAKASIASEYITGEVGTFVNLKVLKENGETVSLKLERRPVVVPSITDELIDDSIAYIYISSFTEHTAEEFEKVLKKYWDKGIKNLILDLRYNGGGVMESGINSASLLMDKDETIITVKEKNKDKKPTKYTSTIDGFDFKTVILTNKYTASASEILTCAVKENDHAVTVGETTFGKACGQSVFPLSVGGAFRVTSLHYYTPKGNYIGSKGIEPTYEVLNEKYKYKKEEMPKLSYKVKLKNGMENEEVKALEEILYKLNYLNEDPDNKFDYKTEKAVSKFQEKEGLYPYGVCDLTTQTYLTNRFLDTEFTKDSQLEFAINYFKKK